MPYPTYMSAFVYKHPYPPTCRFCGVRALRVSRDARKAQVVDIIRILAHVRAFGLPALGRNYS